MKILIVDDVAEIRAFIRTTLERRLGFSTAEADSVGEALDVMHRRGPFDLVITDIHMNDLTGGSLVRRLKLHEETRELPVLVVSVDAEDDESVQDLIRQGASGFLRKPFAMDELVERVRALLSV